MQKIQPGEALSKFPKEAVLIAQILGGWGDVLQLLLVVASKWTPAFRMIEDLTWSIKTDSIRVDLLGSLVISHFQNGKFENDARKAVAATKSALNARNKYAHCHWGVSDDEKSLIRIDWTKEYKLSKERRGSRVTLKTLENDLAKFSDAASRLILLDQKSQESFEAMTQAAMSRVYQTSLEMRERTAQMIREILEKAEHPPTHRSGGSDRDQ